MDDQILSRRDRIEAERKLFSPAKTVRQKNFIREAVSGRHASYTSIAKAAGYSDSAASRMGAKLGERLLGNPAFIEACQDLKLTPKDIMTEVKRGMTEAMNPAHPDMPDNSSRQKYADMAIKILGGYAPSQHNVDIERRELRIELSSKQVERIERLTGKMVVIGEDFE